MHWIMRKNALKEDKLDAYKRLPLGQKLKRMTFYPIESMFPDTPMRLCDLMLQIK